MSDQSPRTFERRVPSGPWLRMLAVAAVATLASLLVWEVAMRRAGLRAGDLDDGRDYWAVEHRKIDTGPRDAIVIIGDSRILYGTDLSVWENLTGRRPIQLARPATNAQPYLRDLAANEHFAGLAVIGTAEMAYFHVASHVPEALRYVETESPSQRLGHRIHKEASRHLAFLDSYYTLFDVIEQHDWPERNESYGAYSYVWKLSESVDHRQSWMWDRIERDDYLRRHLQRAWMNIFVGEPVTTDVVDRVIESTRRDIDRIRARGGDVVFVRPPSAGPLLELERSRFPRAETWDRLMRETGSFGVHFEDHPSMSELTIPDWSHLSRSSATRFTETYVNALLDRVHWLAARSKPAPANGDANSTALSE